MSKETDPERPMEVSGDLWERDFYMSRETCQNKPIERDLYMSKETNHKRLVIGKGDLLKENYVCQMSCWTSTTVRKAVRVCVCVWERERERERVCVCLWRYIYIYTYTHVGRILHVLHEIVTHPHAHTQTNTHTHSHSLCLSLTHTHTYTHTHAHAYTHTHTHIHIYIPPKNAKEPGVGPHTHIHIHILAHTYRQTHTDTHIHTHTHTHIHTHALVAAALNSFNTFNLIWENLVWSNLQPRTKRHTPISSKLIQHIQSNLSRPYNARLSPFCQKALKKRRLFSRRNRRNISIERAYLLYGVYDS